jgi:hypothetical protein
MIFGTNAEIRIGRNKQSFRVGARGRALMNVEAIHVESGHYTGLPFPDSPNCRVTCADHK